MIKTSSEVQLFKLHKIALFNTLQFGKFETLGIRLLLTFVLFNQDITKVLKGL